MYKVLGNQHEPLFEFINTIWKVDSSKPQELNTVNIEDVLEVLNQGSLRVEGLGGTELDYDCNALYQDAQRLIYKFLTEYSIVRPEIGKGFRFVPFVQKFIYKYRPSAIITLNWDLVFEATLRNSDPRYFPWSYGYGFKPAYYYENPRWILNGVSESWRVPIPVLKLHGSVNWQECPECHRLFVLNQLIIIEGMFTCPNDSAPLARIIHEFHVARFSVLT